jgi:Cys-tRNA(Pro)/Cys-tRNA(Cys) deacylase
LKEVFPLTGYIRGGVSPIGAKKHYPVYLDSAADKWPKIAVSAGMRGLQLLLSSKDLLRVTNGKKFENI